MSGCAVSCGDIYDIIGLGFGPAGIALAVAMEDADECHAKPDGLRSLFIEQAVDSAWQADMLLPGTNIQHHFLRDFATPRNPRSRFTFANYLKEKGRLFAFGLLGDSPGRIEWADYVQWVASQVAHRALYLHRVVSVEPVRQEDGPEINLVRVVAKDLVEGNTKEFYARNITLCTGRKPNIPPRFADLVGPRVFHSHYFKTHVRTIRPETNPTFAVIGSGQNAIEIILNLADNYPGSKIYSINRNSGFRLYDLGHFSNQVFFPEEVEYYYSLPKEARHKLFEEVRLTNYSSVDFDVSRALYWRVYEEGISGNNRINILKRVAVSDISQEGQRYHIRLQDIYKSCQTEIDADVVVLCTGFVEVQVPPYMEQLLPYLSFDADGDLEVTRDYEVRTDERLKVGVFLNGLTERTHGISDATSFSMMALKAQKIFERLEAKRQQLPLFTTTAS